MATIIIIESTLFQYEHIYIVPIIPLQNQILSLISILHECKLQFFVILLTIRRLYIRRQGVQKKLLFQIILLKIT